MPKVIAVAVMSVVSLASMATTFATSAVSSCCKHSASSASSVSSASSCCKHKKHHCCHAKAASEAVVASPVVYKDVMPAALFIPHWYVGANLGESRTHDNAAANSGDSVTQIGPGWSVDLGYQFIQFYKATLAAELGYTQYHQSTENRPQVNVANTEHFSSYAAGVVEYPLGYNMNVLGKLGLAYSYAKKVFTAAGTSASANNYSLYYGAGVSYDITSKTELMLQWARARGNSKTGSTDLTSLGLTYHFM